jgi:hypothetical protein
LLDYESGGALRDVFGSGEKLISMYIDMQTASLYAVHRRGWPRGQLPRQRTA